MGIVQNGRANMTTGPRRSPALGPQHPPCAPGCSQPPAARPLNGRRPPPLATGTSASRHPCCVPTAAAPPHRRLGYTTSTPKGKKNKLSRSGKSTNSTPTKGSAYFADVVDDDTDSS
ncbi:hypothetical protein SORBI_3005G145550 [Sorghum bicolor]|uniref:Uncharacterized protein n=1 Tax=Sorghum bicolor TaxID=4558 RepID=A0A1Z5RJJ5_SORBI|nr:hypothetical protein SORBI_3005G145550 [Sorghum bicolor]